jgi:hypothetical protein
MRSLALTCKNASGRDCPALLAVAQFGQIVPGSTTSTAPSQLGHLPTTAVDSVHGGDHWPRPRVDVHLEHIRPVVVASRVEHSAELGRV